MQSCLLKYSCLLSKIFSERVSCVRSSDINSSWSAISSAVPQASALGPVSFCLVVDNYCCNSSNSFCVKSADDFI